MDGVSTRFAFKIMAATFNHDTTEVAADPVHLMYVLEQAIRREQLPDETSAISSSSRPSWGHATRSSSGTRSRRRIWNVRRLRPEPVRPLRRLRRRLDRGSGLQDPDTGQLLDRELLNQELTKIEKPAGIANPKDFRNEVVKFAAHARAERRQEPVLDQLRETPRGHREADVLAG